MKISEYWINELKKTDEFSALSRLEDEELAYLETLIKEGMDDQFIQTAREKGIAKREQLLAITPFADDTLESRRFRVQALWNSKLPYTYRTLVEKLNHVCGDGNYVLQLDHGNYSLKIKLELTVKRMFDSVEETVQSMAPANLILVVELRYRTHQELRRYTHAELSQWTHQELREEALV